jgi:serine/threonine protein kinase
MGRVSLRDYLVGERLPPNVAAAWSADFCHGLGHAITRGLVAHRDIKPENLLIGASGVLRITDFGIAWTVRPESEGATIAGTPPYMAPEQWCGEEQDIRTDLYAFGVVLYEMCYGSMPLGGRSAVDFRDQHLRVRPDFAAHPFARVMARCLSKEPAARYAGPDELLVNLTDICRAEGIALPPKPQQVNREADDLHGLSHALSAIGNRAEAVVAARRLVSIEPNSAGNWTQLARLLMVDGDDKGAIEALDRSLTLDPTRSAPWNNLGLILNRQRKWEHALAAFDRALVSDPVNTGALLNSTTPLCQLGRHGEALDRLKRAAALAPDKYMIWNNLGSVYVELGRKGDAIASFQRARA